MQHDTVKNLVDVGAAGLTLTTILGWVPWFVAVLTGIYTTMRIVIEWPRFCCAISKAMASMRNKLR